VGVASTQTVLGVATKSCRLAANSIVCSSRDTAQDDASSRDAVRIVYGNRYAENTV
jgi:hypothetical protein